MNAFRSKSIPESSFPLSSLALKKIWENFGIVPKAPWPRKELLIGTSLQPRMLIFKVLANANIWLVACWKLVSSWGINAIPVA